MIHLFLLLNLLSTLVLIRSLFNPLLRLGGIKGEATVKFEDGGVNQIQGQESVNKVDEVSIYIFHGGNLV